MDLLTGFVGCIVLQTSLQVGLQFHFHQDFCQMKTVLMHSYGDKNVHVTVKRVWERLKTRFQSCILQSSFYGQLSSSQLPP